jgi:hypothetical protein
VKKKDYCAVLVRKTLSEQHACESVNYSLKSLEEWSSDKLLRHGCARGCAWDDPVASMRGPRPVQSQSGAAISDK